MPVIAQPQALLCSDSSVRPNRAEQGVGAAALATFHIPLLPRLTCPMIHTQWSIYQNLITHNCPKSERQFGSSLEAWETSVQPGKSGCGPADGTTSGTKMGSQAPLPGEYPLTMVGGLSSRFGQFSGLPAGPKCRSPKCHVLLSPKLLSVFSPPSSCGYCGDSEGLYQQSRPRQGPL